MLPTSGASCRLAPALDKAGDVESRRVERLQDVVAGGGKKCVLEILAGSASPSYAASAAVEASQFLRSLLTLRSNVSLTARALPLFRRSG